MVESQQASSYLSKGGNHERTPQYAAIYARYSSGQDREKTSTIEAQTAMCREKAKSEGVIVDENHIYIDRGISGGTIQRVGFQEMVAQIEARNFPQILYTKVTNGYFATNRKQVSLLNGFGNTTWKSAIAW